MTRARDLANVADDVSTGTVVTTASPSLGRRNLIINGAMQVAQRGTSITLGAGTGTYTLDRVRSQSNGGGITVSQETNAISGIGTQKMCRYTGASGVTGVYYIYRIESKDVAQINGNSVTFSIYIENNSGASISPTIDYYHPTAADNFSGNTTVASGVALGTVANGSSARLTATTDVSGTTITNGLMLQVNFGSALTSGTIDFTGVQLEVGSVATPFEHRSFGEELALCQRYYEVLANGADSSSGCIGSGNYYTSTSFHLPVKFQVQKRTTSYSLDQVTGTYFYRVYRESGNDQFDSFGLTRKGAQSCTLYKGSGSVSSTAGNGGEFLCNNASAFVAIDNEL